MADNRESPGFGHGGAVKQRTISLVLGGGGARGLAHIGVLQWLTENGYRVESIAGSSMGALVGGIHAAGKLDVYAHWVSALERGQVLRLLDPTFSRTGLFKGERLIGVLRELIGERAIETLPIRFTAVAADLDSGEEVWLRSGSLFDAIRASIALPLVFTPFQIGARTLLDGALVNPVPIAATYGDATDLTVAVNLGGPAEWRPIAPPSFTAANPDDPERVRPPPPRSFAESLPFPRSAPVPAQRLSDIAFISMQIMQDTIARLQLAEHPPDIVVQVPRNACRFHEFWRAAELIALGRERAARAFAEHAAVAAAALPLVSAVGAP